MRGSNNRNSQPFFGLQLLVLNHGSDADSFAGEDIRHFRQGTGLTFDISSQVEATRILGGRAQANAAIRVPKPAGLERNLGPSQGKIDQVGNYGAGGWH